MFSRTRTTTTTTARVGATRHQTPGQLTPKKVDEDQEWTIAKAMGKLDLGVVCVTLRLERGE
jgi:hypothetical protein